MQSLSLATIASCYGETCPTFMEFLHLLLAIPASSAENERAFSRMKIVKSDSRNRMSTETLNVILKNQLLSAPVGEFCPKAAISKWMSDGVSRRPKRSKGSSRASKRQRCEVSVGSVLEEISDSDCESVSDYELSDSDVDFSTHDDDAVLSDLPQ